MLALQVNFNQGESVIMNTRLLAVLTVLALLFVVPASADQSPSDEMMIKAATNFMATLNAEQREASLFPFTLEEWEKWHFIPMPDRIGLRYDKMSADQMRLSDALLITGLSRVGYVKTKTIMSLEQVLFQIESADGGNSSMLSLRESDYYLFAFYGKPGDDVWGWRIEGHHISLHFTVADGKVISSTPAFMGANPHRIEEGPLKGLAVLGAEEDLARALVLSLNDEQKAKAILEGSVPRDIYTGNASRVTHGDVPAKGLRRSEMTSKQKAMLQALIDEYVNNVPADQAAARQERVADSGDDIYFVWIGTTDAGVGNRHYYRVHGKEFLIEYDNIQNGANHSHTAWRDYEKDFGRDWLAEHHKNKH